MSLLDDARRLADDRPVRGGSALKSHPRGCCYYCGADGYGEPHADDCSWLAMPRIVAALEAGEEYIREMEGQGEHIDVLKRVQAYQRLKGSLDMEVLTP